MKKVHTNIRIGDSEIATNRGRKEGKKEENWMKLRMKNVQNEKKEEE
jgi:hypothetical protein